VTNKEHMKLLHDRINELAKEIQTNNLEDKYRQLMEKCGKDKTALVPVTDVQWEVMLPKERDAALLHHYHTLRTEYMTMRKDLKESTLTGRLREWLESPWARVTFTGVALAETAAILLHIAHGMGLFLKDDAAEDTRYLA
jgi:hypothetical protein